MALNAIARETLVYSIPGIAEVSYLNWNLLKIPFQIETKTETSQDGFGRISWSLWTLLNPVLSFLHALDRDTSILKLSAVFTKALWGKLIRQELIQSGAKFVLFDTSAPFSLLMFEHSQSWQIMSEEWFSYLKNLLYPMEKQWRLQRVLWFHKQA